MAMATNSSCGFIIKCERINQIPSQINHMDSRNQSTKFRATVTFKRRNFAKSENKNWLSKANCKTTSLNWLFPNWIAKNGLGPTRVETYMVHHWINILQGQKGKDKRQGETHHTCRVHLKEPQNTYLPYSRSAFQGENDNHVARVLFHSPHNWNGGQPQT
jgi:hypothetical protein